MNANKTVKVISVCGLGWREFYVSLYNLLCHLYDELCVNIFVFDYKSVKGYGVTEQSI